VDEEAMGALLARQHGVVARRQLHDLGYRPHDIERLTRRRVLARIHPGVYLEHTGPPSWQQRAWAAVLALWPSALCGESALVDEPGPADPTLVHVAVARDRRVAAPPGVRVHRLPHLDARVLWNRSPPRLRYEDAVIDVAARACSDFAALGVLAEACRTRRTTPRRLAETMAQRRWLPRRVWLCATLTDLATGTSSVLEHGYRTAVERAHGLPPAERQARASTSGKVIYRDAEYAQGLVVELDGRIVHNTVSQRDADFERDLDTAVDRHATVRLSWVQVFDRPCSTALKIARLLQQRGWPNAPHPCSPGCQLNVELRWI